MGASSIHKDTYHMNDSDTKRSAGGHNVQEFYITPYMGKGDQNNLKQCRTQLTIHKFYLNI